MSTKLGQNQMIHKKNPKQFFTSLTSSSCLRSASPTSRITKHSGHGNCTKSLGPFTSALQWKHWIFTADDAIWHIGQGNCTTPGGAEKQVRQLVHRCLRATGGFGGGGGGWWCFLLGKERGREVEEVKLEREENGFVGGFRVWGLVYGLCLLYLLVFSSIRSCSRFGDFFLLIPLIVVVKKRRIAMN